MPAAVTNSCSVRGWYVAASGCGCVHAPDGVVLIISMACTMFHPGVMAVQVRCCWHLLPEQAL